MLVQSLSQARRASKGFFILFLSGTYSDRHILLEENPVAEASLSGIIARINSGESFKPVNGKLGTSRYVLNKTLGSLMFS